jgi:hypothetical protein
MQVTVTLADVQAIRTRQGNIRYVSRDTDGQEYTTFRSDIGQRAEQLRGSRVHIEYHEERRGQYTNVYLDKIEEAEPTVPLAAGTNAQEAAWQTAVAAAPWLVGESGSAVSPGKLYDTLKPFEERVADDIERHEDERKRSAEEEAEEEPG